MSYLKLFSEPDFDSELRQSLHQWRANVSAPPEVRQRVLETAVLAMEYARPDSRTSIRKGARLPTYKDIEHRMSNNVMLYASPLGFAMLGLRA
jgi:hypothetical protein